MSGRRRQGQDTTGIPADFERLGELLRLCGAAPGDAGAAPHGHPSEEPGRCVVPTVSRVPPPDPNRALASVWSEVVGAGVAANARPVQLRAGRLVVSTSSSAWAQTLQSMSEAIIARLNERLGPGSVERAVFRHAGWESRPPVAIGRGSGPNQAAPPAPALGTARLTKEQVEALAAIEQLDLSPELRARILRAVRAGFVRGEQETVR